MGKYLSILKDSFREAIDTKVFYATLSVSCLVVLLVASVTFRPVPPQESLEAAPHLLKFLLSTHIKDLSIHTTDFQETRADEPPWRRDYEITYVVELPSDTTNEQRGYFQQQFMAIMGGEIKRQCFWIDHWNLGNVSTGTGRQLRFKLSTRGTKVSDRLGWPHEAGLFFGILPLSFFQTSLAAEVIFIADTVIGSVGAAVTMLLSIIITGFFIPNMLRKGTIDMLLAKPIRRSSLLVYKWIGGMTFMFLNTLVIMAGIWLALGLQTDLWLTGLLWCIPIFTFQFAIFYAVSTLLAVLSRSPIVAILGAVLTWGLCFFIGWGYRIVDTIRPEKPSNQAQAEMVKLPRWVFVSADAIHFVTPRYKDLDILTSRLINRDLRLPESAEVKQQVQAVSAINWPESIGVTAAFIAMVMGLACWRFAVKDY